MTALKIQGDNSLIISFGNWVIAGEEEQLSEDKNIIHEMSLKTKQHS